MIQKIKELKDDILKCLCEQPITQLEGENVDELGKWVDMIKDLAEAEKDCIKACYYASLIEEEFDSASHDSNRPGYDNWRYSSGRFAPKGKGSYDPRSGYVPHLHMPIHHFENEIASMMPERLGYPMSGSRYPMSNPDDGHRSQTGNTRRGYLYDQWKDSRQKYDESGMLKDKESLSSRTNEYMDETASTIKEMWNAADPSLKKKMKADLNNLIGEMVV